MGFVDGPDESRPEVATLVTTVVTALHRRLAEITSTMSEALAGEMEQLEGDGAIVDLLRASVEGNVENILNALRLNIPVANIEPPSAAFEYARRLAQRGVAVSDLVRAYRLGQQHLLELAFAECEATDAEAVDRAEALQRIVGFTFTYIDWISEGVVTVYEGERERWLTELNGARVSRVEELINGVALDVDATESVIGYRLRVPHLAAVLWVHDTGAQQDQVSRFNHAAAAIGEKIGSGRKPLVIPRDRASAWAWFPVADDLSLDLRAVGSLLAAAGGPPVPMAAFGLPQSGPAGFRRSHLQAIQAQQVALIRDDPTHPVISFDEPGLKVAALLASELDTTRDWVHDTLGDLARDDEHHDRLRRTMMLFFQNDSNYTATAEAMLMHKNSVKYRLASAEKALGRPLSADRQAIELALTACHWLGPTVLITES